MSVRGAVGIMFADCLGSCMADLIRCRGPLSGANPPITLSARGGNRSVSPAYNTRVSGFRRGFSWLTRDRLAMTQSRHSNERAESPEWDEEPRTAVIHAPTGALVFILPAQLQPDYAFRS
jgi:hypothetical protein